MVGSRQARLRRQYGGCYTDSRLTSRDGSRGASRIPIVVWLGECNCEASSLHSGFRLHHVWETGIHCVKALKVSNSVTTITREVTSNATKVEAQLKLLIQVALLKWSEANECHGLRWFAFDEIGGGKLAQDRSFQTVIGITHGAHVLEARNCLVRTAGGQQAGDVRSLRLP